MASPVLEIDTKGTCLFCLNPNCAPSSNKTKFDLTTATAIKMLFRYLNIDIKKVASVSSSSSDALLLDASTNLGVTLCDSCFFLVDEFLELFQDSERVRLQLERCAWTLYEFVEKGNKNEDRVREYHMRVSDFSSSPQLRFSEQLRKETFEKCSVAHSLSIPRICLRRGATYSMGKDSDTRFQNNIEHSIKIHGGILEDAVHVKLESEYQNVNTSGSDWDINEAASTISEEEQLTYPANIGEEEICDSDTKSEDIPSDPLSVKETVCKTIKRKCIKCNKWFSSNSTRNRHIREIHNRINGRSRNSKPELKCVYCSQYSSQRSSLVIHQYALHPLQMLSKVLPVGVSEKDLNRALESIISMDWGLSGSTTKSDRHRTCPLCSKVYNAAYRIRTHVLQSHQDEVCRRIQTCDGSPKQASGSLVPATPPKIKIHQTSSTPRRLKPSPEVCASSRRKFPDAVPCDICGKKFGCKKYAKDHKNRVHLKKIVRVRTFKCYICDKTFLTKLVLQRHHRAFHLKILQSESRKTLWKQNKYININM